MPHAKTVAVLVALIVPCGFAALLASAQLASSHEASEATADEVVETFVLTPIQMETF